MSPFGIRDFQLYMLATMPPSDRVAEGLAELGSDVQEARAAIPAAKDAGFFDFGHRVSLERSIFGIEIYQQPMSDSSENDRSGFGGSMVVAFRLPVFRGFDFLVNVTPDGIVWGQRLGRSRGEVAPLIRSADDLRPWSHLKGEVQAAVSNFETMDAFSFSEDISGVLLDSEQGEGRLGMRFDFELLQRVSRM